MIFPTRSWINLTELILTKHALTLLVFFLVWVFVSAYVVTSTGPFWLIALIPCIYEMFLRYVFFFSYGRQYRYALTPYVLVDRRDYGYGFRTSIDISKVDFALFDKFLFPPDAGRLTDLGENKARRVNFTVNSRGFRGNEFTARSKQGKLRIFCSGGSTTAGQSVGDTDTWPAALEKSLVGTGVNAEVINAGVFGWASHQEAARIQNEIVHYEPDVILLHQGWNDEFHYSSLAAGQAWHPRLMRGRRETSEFYFNKSSIFSSDLLLSQYLAVRHFRRRWVYDRYLSFSNDRRWRVLQDKRYIVAWGQAIVDIARAANAVNALVYTIDYPGLVDIRDTPQDRDLYVNKSRLTHAYANYQAISKRRISHTLADLSSLVPCLNITPDFAQLAGGDRLRLFFDEIHYSEQGSAEVGRQTSAHLLKSEPFIARINNGSRLGNVKLADEGRISAILDGLGENPAYIERLISANRIKIAVEHRLNAVANIPNDRYTTF